MKVPGTVMTDSGFTVEGCSPELLGELLLAYEYEVAKQAPQFWSGFNPGIGRTEIVDRLGAIGLEASEELIVWWGWKDGFREETNPGMRLPPMGLEFSLKLRSLDHLGTEEDQWNPHWIRVAGYSSQDALAATTRPDSLPLARATSPDDTGTQDDEVGRQVVSLCTPVSWWLLGIAKGWSKWDGKFWQVDDEKFPYEWQLTDLLS